MIEDGPILLWSKNKKPSSENFKFTKLDTGLWKGELIKSTTNRVYTIKEHLN